MLNQIRYTALVAIGAAVAVIMLGLAALIAIPVLIGGAALALVGRGMLNARIDRVLREHTAMEAGQTSAGEVIEGEWTVIDLRAPQAGRSS